MGWKEAKEQERLTKLRNVNLEGDKHQWKKDPKEAVWYQDKEKPREKWHEHAEEKEKDAEELRKNRLEHVEEKEEDEDKLQENWRWLEHAEEQDNMFPWLEKEKEEQKERWNRLEHTGAKETSCRRTGAGWNTRKSRTTCSRGWRRRKKDSRGQMERGEGTREVDEV